MMLRGIMLAGFKSFAGETEMPIGRITCLIGPNGAGKSNALLGLERIASILSGEEYLPKKSDYFDDNEGSVMRLGATLRPSAAERQVLLDKAKGPALAVPVGPEPERPADPDTFRLVKYEASFRDGSLHKQEIWMPAASGKFYTHARATLQDGACHVERRDLDKIYSEDRAHPSRQSGGRTGQPSAPELFGMVDTSLASAVKNLFTGLKTIPAGRAIPAAVAVRQSGGLATDGRNLPNELNDLRRAEQTEFDKRMARITHGDPSGVEPRTVGTDLVLEVREKGISRRAAHTELGSGQLQTLILGWQMFRGRGTIFVVREPELHLHAERQRSVLRAIRDKSREDGAQFVIETHSPVFLGADADDRVVLVAKDAGRSRAIEIAADNVDLIRREMGITHADALRPSNVLLVEGPSDLAAFGTLLGAVSPSHALSTSVYSLGGAYNAKNLALLIRYLEAEGRRIFLVLDEDGEARRHIEKLEGEGLLGGNCRFLAKDLEDEFDSELVVRAAAGMAADAGCKFSLTAADLDASRRGGEAVAASLKRRWNAKKCGRFSKIRLAEHVVRLLGGRVPPGIEAALRAAVAHFEGGGTRQGGQS